MLHDAVLAAAPVLVVVALIFGPLCAWLAARRQRNPAIWLAFGAVLGPVALAILSVAPPARCPSCAEPTAGFEARCAACGTGFDSRTPVVTETTAVGAPAAGTIVVGASERGAPTGAPLLRSLPDPADEPTRRPRRGATRRGAVPGDAPGDAQPARLSAVGARRPETGPIISGTILDGTRHDVTLLAMAVLVLGAPPLRAGSRYVIARTRDRLLVIGPVEASDEHVEFSVPLTGVEANFVADRLVITAAGDRAQRSLLIAFQSVSSLTGRAVDEAIMERAAPISIAAGHS